MDSAVVNPAIRSTTDREQSCCEFHWESIQDSSKRMAESHRPRPFKQIEDSIIVGKAKYKPLQSQECAHDQQDNQDISTQGSQSSTSKRKQIPAEITQTKKFSEKDASEAISAKPKRNSEKQETKTAKTNPDKNPSSPGAEIQKQAGWTRGRTDDQDQLHDEFDRREEEPKAKKSNSTKNKDATTTKSTKKKSQASKKSGSISAMVGAVTSVMGSVVQDKAGSAQPSPVAAIEGLEELDESSETGGNEDQSGEEAKMSIAGKITAMVSKHKSKKLLSKDSIVINFKMCPVPEHDQFLSLYCQNKKCQKPICALCLREEHKDHEVRDLNKVQSENRETLSSLLDKTTRTFKSLKITLTSAKQTITESTKNAIESLESRRETVMKMFDTLREEMVDSRADAISDIDKKLAILDDNAALLTSIDKDSKDLKKRDEVASVLRMVHDVKANTEAILNKSKVCTHYEYKDSKISLEELNRICGGLTRVETSLDLQEEPERPNITLDKGNNLSPLQVHCLLFALYTCSISSAETRNAKLLQLSCNSVPLGVFLLPNFLPFALQW